MAVTKKAKPKAKPKTKKAPKKVVKNPKAKMGRPTKKTKAIEAKILDGVAAGYSMRKICTEDDGLPSSRTIWEWLNEDDEFSRKYGLAKEECADFLAEESMEIADSQVGNPLEIDGVAILDKEGKPIMIVDGPAVSHAKLRIDTRKWYASKLKPKKFGEAQLLKLAGDEDNPIRVEKIERVIVKPKTTDTNS